MLDSREVEGFWWLPSNPDREIPGTLHFSQADVRLELMGAFADPLRGARADAEGQMEGPREVRVPFGSFINYEPRILGRSKGGHPVTLERCNGRSLNVGFPASTSSSYGPHFALLGAWYEPDEEVAFDEVTIRFSDLDTWAMTSGFATSFGTTEDGKSFTSIGVAFTPPESITCSLGDETTFELEFPYTFSGMDPVTTELRIAQFATIRFVFKRPANLERALTYVAVLRNFLALAVGRPIQVLAVHGFHNPPPDAEPDPFTRVKPRKIDVEILYRLVGLPEAQERVLHPSEMLFTLGDIHGRLEQVLSAWFEKQEPLGPVLVRYFHLVHTRPSSREHEFESLVRVLETHHRRTVDATGPTPEHEARLEAILAAVPEEHRDWLAKKLAHSHEPTLADRLAETLARCPDITSRLIGATSTKRKSFIRKVTSTRNYEVHLDPAGQLEAARGARLLALVMQLRPLVEMTLLREIGFSCDEIAALFNREGHRYREAEHFRNLS